MKILFQNLNHFFTKEPYFDNEQTNSTAHSNTPS